MTHRYFYDIILISNLIGGVYARNYFRKQETRYARALHWDTYRIIIPMNELMDDSLDIAFYYPTFDIKHPEFGGVISVETFYKYFFDISYHDIIAVEEKYGRNTDELFIETFFYCVNHYMKNGNIDKNVVQSLSTKYIDLC